MNAHNLHGLSISDNDIYMHFNELFYQGFRMETLNQ